MLRPETATARRLRREMSLPEVMLWQRLRAKATGAKFRRQHPVGPSVADFCCLALRLIVEIDGRAHDDAAQAARDIERRRFLVENGFEVVVFAASDVLKDADGVAASIAALAARPLHQPAAGPPPLEGED